MSEQSSLLPDDEPRRPQRPGKKRRGPYEIWWKHRYFFGRVWSKMRGYETEEIARQNLEHFERKWNRMLGPDDADRRWDFMLRMPGDPEPSNEN